MYPPGNSRRTLRLDLVRAMRPQVLAMGLASAPETDELDTAARAHVDRSLHGSHVRPALPHLGPQTWSRTGQAAMNRVSPAALLNDFAETLGDGATPSLPNRSDVPSLS